MDDNSRFSINQKNVNLDIQNIVVIFCDNFIYVFLQSELYMALAVMRWCARAGRCVYVGMRVAKSAQGAGKLIFGPVESHRRGK